MEQGVGVKGLIMVSPLFVYRESKGTSLLQHVARLPTYVAVARDAKADGRRAVKRADLADVEAYARGEFLADLVNGATNFAASSVAGAAR